MQKTIQNGGANKSHSLSFMLRIALSAVAILCFAAFFVFGPMEMLSQKNDADGFYIFIACVLSLASVAFFLFKKENIKSDIVFASFLVVTAAAVAMRLFLFDAISNDYVQFLSRWLTEMRGLSGVEPITTPIGDYNMPYLYFLFGVSKNGLYDLYQIKMLSVIFDIVLALGVMKLVSVFKKGEITLLAAYTAALFIPTVFLNSAYWGQCDGIYTAFSVWALYFALSERPKTSVIFFALAFSFKIQTIFILPIIIFLIVRHKIKMTDLLLFPVTFILTLVPAIICGRGLYDTFSIYIDQTASYPNLTLNCPTFWALFPDEQFDIFGDAALFLAGAVCLFFMAYLFTNREKLNSALLFDAAFIFTLILPFFLPRMHERYFYLAEVMSVIYVLIHKNRFYIPPLIIFTSFCCYCPYLFGYRLLTIEVLTFINIAIILYILKTFSQDISNIKTIPDAKEEE